MIRLRGFRMTRHIFLPFLSQTSTLTDLSPASEYQGWLYEWLNKLDYELESDNVSSSICLQAAITELVLFKEARHDWPSILKTLLTDMRGRPLAYSEAFGRQLSQFNQWRQSPVHAIHTHFWIYQLAGTGVDHLAKFGTWIEELIQPNGWIYDPKVSPTHIRTRMKSEYLMSFAMGIEILHSTRKLEFHKDRFVSTLAAQPLSKFLSAEYFRIVAAEVTGSTEQLPLNLAQVVLSCALETGYCDFSVAGKTDDYMGTAKRTDRDEAIPSPLACLHALQIARHCDVITREEVHAQANEYCNHLLDDPFDIPAFHIRDVLVPFGTDVTPLEIIAAAILSQELTATG